MEAGRWRRRESLGRPRSSLPRTRLCGQLRFRAGLGVRLRGLAGVAEHVLREALALAARPVDGGPALLPGYVSQPVDGHEFEVVGHPEKVLHALPVLGYLHRRGHELDAHAELGGGEPDVLDGGTHPEDGVETGELAGPVLTLVQKNGED